MGFYLNPFYLLYLFVPIVKNKTASICSKSNYNIPTALANVVSKVFETIIYDRIAYSLSTCNNQFNFKTKHSTDMCLYAFKEAVLKYRSLNPKLLIAKIMMFCLRNL